MKLNLFSKKNRVYTILILIIIILVALGDETFLIIPIGIIVIYAISRDNSKKFAEKIKFYQTDEAPLVSFIDSLDRCARRSEEFTNSEVTDIVTKKKVYEIHVHLHFLYSQHDRRFTYENSLEQKRIWFFYYLGIFLRDNSKDLLNIESYNKITLVLYDAGKDKYANPKVMKYCELFLDLKEFAKINWEHIEPLEIINLFDFDFSKFPTGLD
jgi:hypothetical protein